METPGVDGMGSDIGKWTKSSRLSTGCCMVPVLSQIEHHQSEQIPPVGTKKESKIKKSNHE